jgi:hypothetical protein
VFGDRRLGQGSQEDEDLLAIPQIPTGQLANDEWMGKHFSCAQQLRQASVPRTEVGNPDRRIDEGHAPFLDRRRRMGESPVSVPPNVASRRALSLAMSASRPMRTRAVFSSTPASVAAFRSKVSSMFSVVLMCMNMHVKGIFVKRGHPRLQRDPPSLLRDGSTPIQSESFPHRSQVAQWRPLPQRFLLRRMTVRTGCGKEKFGWTLSGIRGIQGLAASHSKGIQFSVDNVLHYPGTDNEVLVQECHPDKGGGP